MRMCAYVCVCQYSCPVSITVLTFSAGCVPVGGGHACPPGAGQSATVEEDGQVDDVPHVVVAVDVGVSQDAVQVLVDGFDYNVWITGEDGDEGSFGE